MSDSHLLRTIPLAGDKIKTDEDASNRHSQGVWFPGVDDIDYVTGKLPEDAAIAHVGPMDIVLVDVIVKASVLSERFLLLFDADALQVDGTAPVARWTLPAAGSSGTRQRTAWSQRVLKTVTVGAVIALSTTPGDLTVTAGSEAWFRVKGKLRA